jgi:hypothetical protein
VTWKLAAQQKPQQPAADSDPHHNMPNMPGMPGMSLDPTVDDSSHRAEQGAMSAMNHGPLGGDMHHHMGPHMHMTSLRPATPEDWAKADEIVAETREAIGKYKDYREAIADGFHIFLPNLPQPEYHFTNYWNGFLESFSFDPSRPTSLLYKKTKTGYELTGVMFTMPKGVTEEQLNARIPLSVAQWHLHTNLCMPAKGQTERADWTRFGLQGSITTKEECTQAEGRFYPVIFGWMVHVYPFEDSRAKVWGQ